MPLTSKGTEIEASMKKEYGDKKGEEVFYASKNKGTISGVDSARGERNDADSTTVLAKAQKFMDKANELDKIRSSERRSNRREELMREAAAYRKEAEKLIESTFDSARGDATDAEETTIQQRLDSMAQQVHDLTAGARRVVERMDALAVRADDEAYKGYKIIPGGAGETYAVFEKGIAIKTKLASVEAAKKWIDKRVVERMDGLSRELGLWKYNKVTGYWVHQRSVTDETKNQWLSTFKGDEPNESFKISLNRPSGKP